MNRKTVRILIPLYRPQLAPKEEASLRNTCRVLASYPITLLVPEGMELPAPCRELAGLDVRAVSDEWLGTRNGIAGYNRMMLSADFYACFADTDYLLICHTDAWIFRDELQAWCDAGYDCVAAPWVRRPVYSLPLVRHYMRLRDSLWRGGREILRQDLYGRVGNGGLSLRRTDSFREACIRYRERIETFLGRRDPLYNEDVFWALVPEDFRYPSQDEALRFSIDTNPAYCFRMLEGRLPMGCHSWSKPRMWRFWRRFIPIGPDPTPFR